MTKLGETSTETFRDVALHPKKYRFDEAPERFHSDFDHHVHRESTTDDNDENGITFCNYENDYQVSFVVDANHLCAENATCVETLEVDNAYKSEALFEAWMKAMEKMAVNKEGENEESQEMLSLLDQLHQGSKKKPKKAIIKVYVRNLQENLSDYVQSAGVGHLIEELDRMMEPRLRRGGTRQKGRLEKWRRLTRSKRMSIRKKRAEEKILLHTRPHRPNQTRF